MAAAGCRRSPVWAIRWFPDTRSVGRIVAAGPGYKNRLGEVVFVPGATCFGEIRGLFGGAASRLVVPSARAVPIDSYARRTGGTDSPRRDRTPRDRGRCCARPDRRARRPGQAAGAAWWWPCGDTPPVVWETNPRRMRRGAGLPGSAPRRRYAQRLQMYLRRQRRFGDCWIR